MTSSDEGICNILVFENIVGVRSRSSRFLREKYSHGVLANSDWQQVVPRLSRSLDRIPRFDSIAVADVLSETLVGQIGEIVKRLDSLSVVFPIGRLRSLEGNRFDDQPWTCVSQSPALRARSPFVFSLSSSVFFLSLHLTLLAVLYSPSYLANVSTSRGAGRY